MTDTHIETASRLTLKDLNCDGKAVLKLPDSQPGKLALAHIYGIVSRVGFQQDDRTGATYTFFIGNFEGVNLITGETLQSNKLYLPDGAATQLESYVSQIQSKRGKSATVNFAYEISAVKSKDTKAGFVYDTKPLMKIEMADPLATLRETIPEHKPQPVNKKSA